jgi:hypothetical protein
MNRPRGGRRQGRLGDVAAVAALSGLLIVVGAYPPGPLERLAGRGASDVAADVDEDILAPYLGLGVVTGLEPAPGSQDVRVNENVRLGEQLGCAIQSETTLASFNERVYVAYNDSGDCVKIGSSNWAGFARSTDDGRTFEELGPIAPNNGITRIGSDPVLVVDQVGEDAGTVYLAAMAEAGGRDTLAVARSTNGGQTFTWHDAAPQGVAGIQDKEWLVIDNTGGPRDGWLYLAWTDFGNRRLVFSRSTDGGRTWSPPRILSFDGQGVRPAVAPSGDVHVVWRGYDDGSPAIFWTRSTDGGITFPVPEIAARTSRTGHDAGCGLNSLDGQIRTQEFPSIAIDTYGLSDPAAPGYNPARGTVYVAFAGRGSSEADESDVFLAKLPPGSSEWTEPVRVHDDTSEADQFFPEVAVSKGGTVSVAWTDRREDPNNLLMGQYMATSTDGGGTFGASARFSDVNFPPPYTRSGVASCYAGDYNALVAGAEGRLLAAWGDNRDGIQASALGDRVIPDPNVYFDRIDISA